MMDIKIKLPNPFSFDFNWEEISQIIDYEGLSKANKDILAFAFDCNKLFLQSYKNITDVFSQFETKQEILDFIFKSINEIHLTASASIMSNQIEGETFTLNSEKIGFLKYPNPNGVEINATNALERGGDILNVLIAILETYLKKNEFKKRKTPKRNIGFHEVWFYAGNIYSFNSFYEIIEYENGSIDISGNTAKISLSEQYKSIKKYISASGIRDSNHVNEYNIYLRGYERKIKGNLFLENKILTYSVNDGHLQEIKLIKNKGLDDNEGIDFSRYLNTHKYLGLIELDYFEKINLLEVFKVFAYLQRAVQIQIKNNLQGKTFELAYKINRKKLIDYLSEASSVKFDIVEKIIASIIEISDTPYFWRKPLYQHDEDIYLSYSLLSAPNVDLLLENILDSAKIELPEQINYFKEEIIQETKRISKDYLFELHTVDGNKFSNNIVYELRDYFLLIEVAVIRFPIESNEINDSLDYLSGCVNEVKKRAIEFKELITTTKEVIPIIITNYSHFSGLFLNGVSIFDTRLFKNYFVVGEFLKSRINYGSKTAKASIYNRFKYYDNEDEFNSSFLSFQYNPLPIAEILNKLYWKEMAAFPINEKGQIYIDVCDYVDDNENIEIKINQLNSALKLQYFNTFEQSDNLIIDKTIQYYLTDIFNLLSFGKYDFSLHRFKISEIFQKINIKGFAHLVIFFRNTLNNLETQKIKSARRFNNVKYDNDKTLQLIPQVLGDKKTIRLSDFQSAAILSKAEEKQLISLNLELLSTITVAKYTLEEIESFLIALTIIKSYKKKYSLDYEFYGLAGNLISALNFNNNYQTARNFAEEILLISIEDKKLYRGWGILFICLEQQKNIFDATIYGCLYITSISTESVLTYNEIVDFFFNILKFSRNIYSNNLVKSVFSYLKTFKLKEYDEQKIHLSYYLSAFLNLKEVKEDNLLKESIGFFKERYSKIIKYKDKGILPWLNYFYNIKRLIQEGKISSEYNVDEIIESLEIKTNLETYLPLKEKHFSNENLRKNFIESIKKVLNTFSYTDYTFETQNLELDAHNLIRFGIANNDAESILVSGFISNDVSLIYQNTYHEKLAVVPLLAVKTNLDFLDNYKEYILQKLELKSNQKFIYLFNSDNDVYALSISHQKEIIITKTKDWTVSKMNSWLNKKDDFYFDSKKYFDISEQEEAYLNLKKELNFTDLNLDIIESEILISTSLDLSTYPINLIVNKEDFIGSTYRVANILLLEWFIENYNDFSIDKNFTSSCWAPIEDGDPDINYGYDKLKPILDANNFRTITGNSFENINSNINIFFAHGELNGSHFKAIYKSNENNSAITSNEKLFGTGDVAILFVCHSGKMDKNFFSNSVTSLVHEIIELGYKTVIAPCWSLEVTIPEFWLEEFLKKFRTGVYISEAVFHANQELAEYKESISNSYFIAEGRLAMHLFGNPNLKISQ